jgi:hypothetical protein
MCLTSIYLRAHYRTIKEVLGWRKSHAQKILLLLVESGVVLPVIQLFYFIGYILPIISTAPSEDAAETLVMDTAQILWQASSVSVF